MRDGHIKALVEEYAALPADQRHRAAMADALARAGKVVPGSQAGSTIRRERGSIRGNTVNWVGPFPSSQDRVDFLEPDKPL